MSPPRLVLPPPGPLGPAYPAPGLPAGRTWPGRRPSAWRRFWDRAPRQLRFTRAGQVLVFIAFATGFAALNTGNNLLFLSWGLVLATIVLSGVLSEGTLRSLVLHTRPPPHARAGENAVLSVQLHNRAQRIPAYAVEVFAEIRGPDGSGSAAAPFQLRLAPGETRPLFARFVPARRGRHEVSRWVARTAYPFGFFEKSRRFERAEDETFFVLPARVDVTELIQSLVTQVGEAASNRLGAGEDFYSLRPYRSGDDVRRVHFRRSARTRRWVVRDNQARAGKVVLLELVLRSEAPAAAVERAISACGSVAEDLLAAGYAVGLLAPGTLVRPEEGDAQRWTVLTALARLEPDAARPALSAALEHQRVIVAMAGASALGGRPHLILPESPSS